MIVPSWFPPPGLVIVAVGSVLSTRRLTTTAEVVERPAPFTTTTRRSYSPSATSVVSHEAAVFVQVPAPAGERW